TPTTSTYPLSLHDALPILGLSVWSENRVRGHGEGRAKTSYSIVCRCKTAGVAEAAHSADRRFSRRRRIAPVTIKATPPDPEIVRSEEHTSELQSRGHLVCR